MIPYNVLSGGKGGGGGGGSPTQTPDNLRSKDVVEVILGISEGPIAGLKDGAKTFYVGDTALQNANGEYNFKTFELNVFPGVDVPSNIVPILGGITNNNAVNVSLAHNTPVTRQTTTRSIGFIEVRLAWARLLISNDNGTFVTDAEFRIEYKKTSSSTWIKAYGADIKVNGKTTGNYVKEFRIKVDSIDNDDYDIRVTKLSIDTTTTYFNDMTWESYQEVVTTPMSFPHTACVQLSGEASDQFTSIPQWSGVYQGLLIQIPSNYNPTTRTYTGIWDGTFQIAFSNNPAWCLYDFVQNDRYGIRSYYPDISLDKYDVYDAGVWCDEMVSDGKGGLQPRYTFNANLAEPRSGKELARYMAGMFNATFFDDLNGKAYLRVDKDDDAAHIFVKENTYDPNFEYSYTDITSRYNDITVTFINPDLNWATDRRRVFDQTLIDKNGRIPLDFIAVGCTNEHEAIRRAWYKLITANTETCLVNFTTNRLGGLVKPFDVMLLCDPDMGYGISGRLKTIAEDLISATLRDPIYLEVGVTYYVTFTLEDGSKYKVNLGDFDPGYNSVLNFTAPLPDNVPAKAAFAMEAAGIIGLPRPFRVTKVEEKDGNPDSILIEGICINRNKWHDADTITSTGTIQYSALPNPLMPPGPTSVYFDERFVASKKQFQITVSPVFNRGAYKYYTNDHSFEVWSRLKGSTDLFVKRELLFGDTLVDHPPGEYEFKILGKSYFGKTTPLNVASVFVFNVTNPMTPPKDIDWIKINKREVYWGYSDPPEDFAGFIVRYQNQVGITSWDDAIQPHQGVVSATSFYTQLIPPTARVILVKAVDAFGVVSANSAIIYRDLGDITATNEVERTTYEPTFTGTKVGCAVSGGQLLANDTGTNMYSGNPSAAMYDGGDMYSSAYSEMTYQGAFTVTYSGELIIDINFEGSGYEASYRAVGETVWRPIPTRQLLDPGNYEFIVRVFGGGVRGKIINLAVIIDAEEIRESFEDLVVAGPGGLRIPITKTYSAIKRVSVIIQDDGVTTAVGYRVFDKVTTIGSGPLIKLVDAAGAYVAGLIDVDIVGYK